MAVTNVKYNETYSDIARREYGDDTKASVLIAANPGKKEPLKFGSVIFVPDKPVLNKRPQNKKSLLEIIVSGQSIPYFLSINFKRHLDGFSTLEFTVPFDPNDMLQRDLFKPLKFQSIYFYIGGTLVYTGVIVGVSPQSTSKSRVLAISSYARCAVLNDCTLPASMYPVDFGDRVTFKNIIETVTKPYGIKVVYDQAIKQPPIYVSGFNPSWKLLGYAEVPFAPYIAPFVGLDKPFIELGNTEYTSPLEVIFEDVSLEPGKKIWPFLIDLAKQRGLLLKDMADGSIMVLKNVDDGPSVQDLDERLAPVSEVSVEYNGQNFYSHISGFEDAGTEIEGSSHTIETYEVGGKPWILTNTPGGVAVTYGSQSTATPVERPELTTSIDALRCFTVETKDSTGGDLAAVVQAASDRMYMDSVQCKVSILTWVTRDEALFVPGQFVKLTAPGAMIYGSYKFQIMSAEYFKDDKKLECRLTLSIPKKPKKFPWDA